MNAIVTGMRAEVDPNTSAPRLKFDVLFYGPPLIVSDTRQSFLSVDIAAGDTTAQLAAKVSAAVDAEGQRITANAPGGSVVPASVIAPSYTKLK